MISRYLGGAQGPFSLEACQWRRIMPSIRFNTQLTNENPLGPGQSHSWYSDGLGDREVVVITAVAASHGPGVAGYISDTLAVEKVRVETALDKQSDPTRKVWYQVRNVGASTIDRYVINVAFLSP
jgi:hypothetical protein